MLLTRACLGLAVVGTSAQDSPFGAQMPAQVQTQMPGVQYQPLPDLQLQAQPPPDLQLQAQMPGVQYQPLPDIQMSQQVPDTQMLYQQMPQLQVQPQVPDPDDGSEMCKQKMEANPLHTGMPPLEVDGVYCAQAADSRWWDVVVTRRNCDGSYAVRVKDDLNTEWPVAQRAYFLDKPCNDFYRQVLLEEGLSEEEIRVTLQNQGFHEQEVQQPPPQEQVQEQVQEQGQEQWQDQVLEQEQIPSAAVEWQEQMVETPIGETVQTDGVQAEATQSRWPVRDKRKMSLKVVAAAAAAGAVPLVYGLSGS